MQMYNYTVLNFISKNKIFQIIYNFGASYTLQDILPYADMLCSGKRQCTIPIGHIVSDGIHPCPVTVFSYLAVDYTCIQGKYYASKQRNITYM